MRGAFPVSFVEVAGQTLTVGRPPSGYVAVVDTHGKYRFVSLEALLTGPPAFIEAVVKDMTEEGP